MDTFKRFTKNSISLFVAKVFSIMFSIVFGIYSARTLGDAGYGQYGFIVVLLGYFVVTSEFGLDYLIVRDVSTRKHQTNEYLSTSIFFKLVTVTLSVLLMAGSTLILGRPDIFWIGFLAAISLFPLALYTSFDNCFRAHERMIYIAIVEIVYMALRSGLGILVLVKGFHLQALFAAFVGVECVRLLLIALFYHVKIAPISFTFQKDLFRHFWKEAVPLASWEMLGVLYVRVEVLILMVLLGDAAVGWYKVSMNVTDLISTVSMIAMSAVLPVMSNYFHESPERLLGLYRMVLRYIVIIMLPVGMAITLFADDLIVWMFGTEYASSVVILQILIWSATLSFILALLGTVILVIDKFRLAAKLSTINTSFKILLSIVLIREFGYIGAPIACLAANAFSLALFIPVVSRTLGHTGIDLALVRSVVVSIALILLGWIVSTYAGYPFLVIGAGFSLYLFLVFKTKMVTDQERKAVRQIFNWGA